MLEVDSYRRMIQHSGFLPHNNVDIDHHAGNQLYYPTATRPEKQNPFMDWAKRAGTPPAASPGSKSDGEDEDDEYRPFTPPPPRERLSYTRYQLELLNGIYSKVRYPNSSQKQLIAKRVGITREQVKIWFQNRRRKDVVGKDKKSDEENKNKSEDDNSDTSKTTSDTESLCSDDSENKQESSMVPTAVMKGIIGELKRFENEPAKGKKKKRSKAARQKQIKKNISNALLHSSYDMVSPPNQVIPNSQGHSINSNNKLNHSMRTSAFESPKDSIGKYPQSVSTFIEQYGIHAIHGQPLPYPLQHGVTSAHSGCDLPVLSDLLSFKTGLESRTDDTLVNSNTSPRSSIHHTRQQSCDNQVPASVPYGFNRFYPFSFIAEQPLLLSTLRHSESFRNHVLPHATYPDEQSAFQALPISALNNPYYGPGSAVSWPNSSQSVQASHFTQL